MSENKLEKTIHPLTDFVGEEEINHPDANKVTYYYEGICPKTGKKLKLPRTVLAEKIALSLCRQLDEANLKVAKGKMIGILIVKDTEGNMGVIKAFSGFWNGKREKTGWVSQIPSSSLLRFAEKVTLKELNEIKWRIIELENLPVRRDYEQLNQQFQQEWEELRKLHRQKKEERDRKREAIRNSSLPREQIEQKILQLDNESRKDDWERRKFKQKWKEKLEPLKLEIGKADAEIMELKSKRKELSRKLQKQMQIGYTITNFAGESLSVGRILGKEFIPTGTGDCCAPKLLHHAAVNQLTPIAMAEVWWGETSPNGEKVAGKFYPACKERCQPLLGFLLSGLSNLSPLPKQYPPLSIPTIYEDEYLLVVDKPSGLPSVPGRGIEHYDSVVARLSRKPGYEEITAVHRLDKDTSGILVLAKKKEILGCLQKLFANRQVEKIYEAILDGVIDSKEGIISLPLWANPLTSPRQEVNWLKGKPSITSYRLLEVTSSETRLQLIPYTGRTHQLRIHCASGLGVAIKGDRIYGRKDDNSPRLYLHAREIRFLHPATGDCLHLKTTTPF
ncbi:MAG: pseudouridine synthase [Geminocystis sp.]|nr:pseudouridine synthase [Geminocystis sp.]MCX8077919.1 pseudouridine synthase [Geminocystis sp.]MDW8115209.1 pseudouridine synthase [Geminocystis sp.]HIK37115.1 RluA family pseudouridine synthase [Geminocystis sp. M7585_C2015_104]